MADVSVLNKGFKDINPLLCGWESCKPGHSCGPAYREYYLLHYVVSGAGSFRCGEETVQLNAGDLFLIRPGKSTFYQADAQHPWSYVWIGFDGQRCEELFSTTALDANRFWLHAAYLGPVFEKIKAASCKGHCIELTLCACIYELFSLLQEHNGRTLRQSDYAARTIDFIRANYTMPVSIENIAQMIGIDRRYLCRIFVRETGQTPKQFLVNTRLERAAAFLSRHQNTVGEVARSVGCEDVFNFSRMFKKKYGLSPLAYKKQRNGMI